MAEDLARRAGLSLNEWLARLMAEEPEDATSQDYFSNPVPFARAGRFGASDEVRRVTEALERLSDRIQSAEGRQALAIAGVERSVREVIARIDAAEREQLHVSSALQGEVEGVRAEQGRMSERLDRLELGSQGPRSAEALKALEAAIGDVAARGEDGEQRGRDALSQLGARLERLDLSTRAAAGTLDQVSDRVERLDVSSQATTTAIGQMTARVERLGESERATNGAIRDLRGACAELDSRLKTVEGDAAELVQTIAENLSARVDEVRQDLAQQLAAAADVRFDRIEQALVRMGEHVRAAEQRSAGALERMGHEVLQVAQNLNTRVQGIEHRTDEAAERVGAQVTRVAAAVEERLARADAIQAQALEKLGGEIARITERLAERISNAERRSAQAIDDVGEQVARVTERIGQRHERSTSELAERIRLSEERTARLLEEARLKIDDRLAETQRRIAEAQAGDGQALANPDDQLFGDTSYPLEPGPDLPERTRETPAALLTQVLLQQAPAESLAFDDDDFAAAAEHDAVAGTAESPALGEEDVGSDEPGVGADAEFTAELLAAAPQEDGPAAAPADADLTYEIQPVSSVGSVTIEDEIGPVVLEPNVAFDMEAEPASLEIDAIVEHETAAAEPEEPSASEAEAWASDEDEPTGHSAGEAAFADPEPLTTRDIIERARAAARRSEARSRAYDTRDSVLEGLTFGRPRRSTGGVTGALMVASLLAAVGLSAAGFLFLEGEPGKLPKRLTEALALTSRGQPPASAPADAPAPLAAMALSPKPIQPVSTAELTAEYSAAAAKLDAGQASGAAEMRRLAEAGYAPAQFYLSKLYEEGRAGLGKDAAQARLWAERAADGGDRAAMHNLALDDFEGVGGPKDPSAAAEWFRRAADLGLLDSQFNLAGLYEHGDGVPRNAAEAYKWYLIAARAGDAESKAGALRVRASLTPEARAVAERAASAFQPNGPTVAPAAPVAAAPPASVSPELVTAQKALNQLGYYQGPTDGAASPALHLAIAAYQRDQGLAVTGAPDAATIGKLSVVTQ